MPPLYLRVFERLLIEANHKDNEIPYKARNEKVIGKKIIKRGERLTSVRDICRWVIWYERGKEIIPNPRTIQNILDWLAENGMIEIYGVKGNRTETHYKVVNYNDYQNVDDDKVTEKQQKNNSLTTEKQQSVHTNNNDKECLKNVKNDKEDISIGDGEEKIPNQKPKKPKNPKPEKDIYGEFEKVSLTADEFNKLLDKLGQTGTNDMIARLDTYKASTGKKYDSDYATILNWNRKDAADGKCQDSKNDKSKTIKPNKFHNFISSEAMGESELEALADKRKEKLLQGIADRKKEAQNAKTN